MIARGHLHVMRPVNATPQPAGGVVFHSRCHAANGSSATSWCGLEEERTVDDAGRVTRVRIRFGGMWFDPHDLLRILPFGIIECPECEGSGGLLPCELCHGLGLTSDDGEPLKAPDLRVH
jgi:hypothetical protein